MIFLNRDITLNISSPQMKLYILSFHTVIERTVSQHCYLGLSSYIIKSID